MSNSPARSRISQMHGLILGIGFSLGVTALIGFAAGRLDEFELRPDRDVAFWYPWVTATPTIWTRVSVWGLYAGRLRHVGQSAKLRQQPVAWCDGRFQFGSGLGCGHARITGMCAVV